MLLIRQTADTIQKALRSKFDQRDFYAILGFIEKGNVTQVAKILCKKPHLSAEVRWSNGQFYDKNKSVMQMIAPLLHTLQHNPFEQNHLEIIQILLKNGANPLAQSTPYPMLQTRIVDELITTAFSSERIAELKSPSPLRDAMIEMFTWINERRNLEDTLFEQPNWGVVCSRHQKLAMDLLEAVDAKNASVCKQAIVSHIEMDAVAPTPRRKM